MWVFDGMRSRREWSLRRVVEQKDGELGGSGRARERLMQEGELIVY